jgi:hypothetical protein
LHKANEFASKVWLGFTAAVDNAAHGNYFAASRSNNLDCFQDLCSACYDVFRYNNSLVWRYSKSASQDEFAILLLGKNMALSKVASDFLANHNSSHRRGNDAVTIDGLKEVGELSADLFR